MIALIDGDILVHAAAFSREVRRYEIHGRTLSFRYKKEAVAHCKDAKIDTRLINQVRTADYDLDKLRYAIDNMMDDILERTGATEYFLFFSGRDVFRHRIGADPVRGSTYKTNRRPENKPLMLEESKEILREYQHFSHPELEADDLLGIFQGPDSIICSIDKDLLQIPGRHFDIRKKEFKLVTQASGWKHFCMQLLTGDAVDGIHGLPGIGAVKAAKLLDKMQSESTSSMEILHKIDALYRDLGLTYMTDSALKLWILRRPLCGPFKHANPMSKHDALTTYLNFEQLQMELGLGKLT